MKYIADIHYDVIRKPLWPHVIEKLSCKFCSFTVTKLNTPKPSSSHSGLGWYNRARAKMIRHLHTHTNASESDE